MEKILESENCTEDSAADSCTPLHLASANGQLASVDQLLKKHANIEAKQKDDMTPLHLACMSGHLAVVQKLITKDLSGDSIANNSFSDRLFGRFFSTNPANIEAKQKSDMTPLHFACQNGHLEVVKYLLKHQASFVAQTNMSFSKKSFYKGLFDNA